MRRLLLAALIGGLVIAQAFLGIETTQAATLTFACGTGDTRSQYCIDVANEWAKKNGHEVKLFVNPQATNDALGLFQQIFAAKSAEIDIVMIDVIWPGLLSSHFVDLRKYIPQDHIDAHFQSIVSNNTDAKGRVIGIPFYTDAGLLYYRKDLLEKHGHTPPKTWSELERIAQDILSKERENNSRLMGFVWQGRAYEGLTCNALEWIDSFGGGSVVEPDGTISINNPKAAAALDTAASWIKNGISPKGILNYAEEDARGAFQSGNAIFMRNWPYAWGLGNSDDSIVKGKIGSTALPMGPGGKHTGALGGWQLAVSKYSKNPEAAAGVVQYLTTKENQLRRAIELSDLPTRPDVYEDPKLRAENPFMGGMLSTFKSAVPRPSSVTGRKYNKVSNKFWSEVHSVLAGKKTGAEAVADLEKSVQRIKRNKW